MVLGLALAAAALAAVASHPYPGATVDSGEYLAVAEGLVEGHGLTMRYVNYDEAFRVVSTAYVLDGLPPCRTGPEASGG